MLSNVHGQRTKCQCTSVHFTLSRTGNLISYPKVQTWGICKHYYIMLSLVEKNIFYDNFVSFWIRHSKHSCQLGRAILNIYVTLDYFFVTLDISCHFEQ